MIVSHLLPGRLAASAALSSKTGTSTQIPSSRPLAGKRVDRLSCESLFYQFLTFLHLLPSPGFTSKVPADFFLPSPHPCSPLPCVHLVFSEVYLPCVTLSSSCLLCRDPILLWLLQRCSSGPVRLLFLIVLMRGHASFCPPPSLPPRSVQGSVTVQHMWSWCVRLKDVSTSSCQLHVREHRKLLCAFDCLRVPWSSPDCPLIVPVSSVGCSRAPHRDRLRQYLAQTNKQQSQQLWGI